MSANCNYLDEELQKLKEQNTVSACFSFLLSGVPEKTKFIRYYFISKHLNKKQMIIFINDLFDLFPYMKNCVEEKADEIVENKYVTISTKNHHMIILTTFMAVRYLEDFQHIVLTFLKYKEDHSVEEAFVLAHNKNNYDNEKAKKMFKDICYLDLNYNHTLLPIATDLDFKNWSNNIRKKFNDKFLYNGLLSNGSRIIHTQVTDNFYYKIIK